MINTLAKRFLDKEKNHMLMQKWIETGSLVLVIATASAYSTAQEMSSGTALVEGHDSHRISFKLTPSYYFSSDNNDAFDLNLRAVLGEHTAWVGAYRDKENLQQSRTGYEYRPDFGLVRPVFSAQLASGGFLGGSVTTEIGNSNFVIAGFGRTNLKDYFNLNFDPNDAITLGIGSRAMPKTELSLFHIWDDRLDTKQHVTHAVARYKPNDAERWTADASYKHGRTGNGDNVQGYALTVTYDFGDYFVRGARDQHANFSAVSQNRISLGRRF
ncbi:MAG: hypothetical protein ACI9ZF_001428 [Bradyrhizobium sp.]